MERVKVDSNWGHWDTLEGVRLQNGEKLRIKWPDGHLIEVEISIEKNSFTYSDHGHEGTGIDERSFFLLDFHGYRLPVYLRDSPLLCERFLSENHLALLCAIQNGTDANAGPFFKWALDLEKAGFITLKPEVKITAKGMAFLKAAG